MKTRKKLNVESEGAKIWLKRLDDFIDQKIEDNHLDNKTIANHFQISERQLFRKLKSITGQTPQKYLKNHRLSKAMIYLKTGKYKTVKETAYAIGYTKSNYFSKQFENEFGEKPLIILRKSGWR